MYDARQFFGICSSLTTESNRANTATNESFNQISKEYFDNQSGPNGNQNFQNVPQTKTTQKTDVLVFTVGGYNEEAGPLSLVESFSMEQRKWKKHS